MNKKLIFLRYGSEKFPLGNPVNIDGLIQAFGYREALKRVCNASVEFYHTTCPTVLSATDEYNNPLWWNEKGKFGTFTL